MRLRIFSSVLLPAPFRPIMPTTSPRLTSKETSLSAQKSSTDFRFPILEQALDLVSDDITQGSVALPFGIVLDAVFFTEIGNGYDRVTHGQITSAKVLSIFRKYQIPEAVNRTTMTKDTKTVVHSSGLCPQQEAPTETVDNANHGI